MTREKFPEKIPFRLTRMLTNAMEVQIVTLDITVHKIRLTVVFVLSTGAQYGQEIRFRQICLTEFSMCGVWVQIAC